MTTPLSQPSPSHPSPERLELARQRIATATTAIALTAKEWEQASCLGTPDGEIVHAVPTASGVVIVREHVG